MELGRYEGKKAAGFSGSVTLEASYLLPLIVFLIWNVLYLSFFLYDQSVLLQGSYVTALRTERMLGSDEEKEREAEKKFEESVEKRLACGSVEKDYAVSGGDVSVEGTLLLRAPGEGFFISRWNGKQRQKADRWRPVEFIRTCRKAEDIGKLLEMGTV